MRFNPLNGEPEWLKEGRDISHTSKKNRKHYLRSLKYYRQLYRATPPWYGEALYNQILKIYAESKRMRKAGRKVHVDHIVPIISKEVCGLNVPWNYQIVSEKQNRIKSNHFWPQKHEHQFEFENFELPPYQMKLL